MQSLRDTDPAAFAQYMRAKYGAADDTALIAAAPDMLAALKVCESVLRIQGYANAADIAQAAIAKATGA